MKCTHPVIIIDKKRLPSDYLYESEKGAKCLMTPYSEEYMNYWRFTRQIPSKYIVIAPCGHCFACLYSKRREWSTRLSIFHKQYTKNILNADKTALFLTLTYNDNNLHFIKVGEEEIAILHRPDYVNFLKRLRINLQRKYQGISKLYYYGCGEYGSTSLRPHYHFLLWGIPEPEVKNIGPNIFTSRLISSTWHNGFVTINSIEEGSINYVSGYVQKKLLNNISDKVPREYRPFNTCSKGLGYSVLDSDNLLLKHEVVSEDFSFYHNGNKIPLLNYQKRKLEYNFDSGKIDKDYREDFFERRVARYNEDGIPIIDLEENKKWTDNAFKKMKKKY